MDELIPQPIQSAHAGVACRRRRENLRKGLAESGFVVEFAMRVDDGFHLALTQDFDVLVLDVMLPGRDGWSILDALRQAGNSTPVLLLTARDTVPDRVKGLELGADDYLVKPFAFSELLARVRTILHRSPVRQPELVQVADLTLDLIRHKAVQAGERLDLDMNHPGAHATKHYEKGVTCTSCHNPHTSGIVTVYAGVPDNANAPTNVPHGIVIHDNEAGTSNFVTWDGEGLKDGVTCTTCHVGANPNHVHYFTAKAETATLECTDCHMPDVININAATLRGALHPHSFRSMRPEIALRHGPDQQPSSCTYRCHQDQGANKTERAQWAASYLQSHLELVAAGGVPGVRVTGLRNWTYTLEATVDFEQWTPLATGKADALGVLVLEDNTPEGDNRFYRAVEE